MNLEESDPGIANLVWEHTFKVIRSSASEIEVNSYNSAAISMNGTGWKQAGDLNENGKLSKIIRKMVRNLQNEILPGKKKICLFNRNNHLHKYTTDSNWFNSSSEQKTWRLYKLSMSQQYHTTMEKLSCKNRSRADMMHNLHPLLCSIF